MINTIRHIELHLPVSWNQCSTDELEAIAAAIINEQQRTDRYHPFDWSRVKLNVVLDVNNIEVVSVPTPVIKDIRHDDTYLVRRSKKEEPWPISVGYLAALIERLSWIDDEKASKLIFAFPYPELKVSTLNSKHSTFIGPPPLLDGYTWREYRWLTDWLQEYMRRSNAKLDTSTAQQEFLKVLFKPKEGTLNTQHSTLNTQLFTSFDPVKWQVILFWWSSLMEQLAKKFPKVLKSQPVNKRGRRPQKKDTPWDFYNQVTATVQKYIGGLSAQDVDNQPYGVTLQQLEMMATEAAEMEKLKHKK